MAKTTLTARGVAALKSQVSRIEIFDDKVTGFYVRVNPTGGKTYGVMYRVNGRKRRLTIGSTTAWDLAGARDRAREAIRLASTGTRDLATEKTDARQADTFSELAAEYVERWAKPRKRSWKEDARIIDRYLNPAFGNVKVADVRRADVRRLLELIAGDAPIMANPRSGVLLGKSTIGRFRKTWRKLALRPRSGTGASCTAGSRFVR